MIARTSGIDRVARAGHARAQPPLHPVAGRGEDRVHPRVRLPRGPRRRATGEQLAAEGAIDTADDVFYLTLDELQGRRPADIKATVRERRATRARYEAVDLPLEWVGMPEVTQLADAAPDDGATTHIEALGVSGGKAEGIARVLVDPNDPDALEPGDVLVCHTTDPSWSSYFFVASAVVIDIGGMLSHGAIVARELGIPCVISTGNGTSTIRSGDRVLVDGDAGTVEILERAKAGTDGSVMTKSHDTGPHDSTDPTYTDTWYWNAIDVDTGIVVWAHISWRPAVGSGQHLVALVHPTGVQRLRADVTDPFHSDLLDIEIVDPWNVSRVSCPPLGWEMEWHAFHPEIDFGALLHTGDGISLDHYEGGGRAHGTVWGDPFAGHGFRDRSFGPAQHPRLRAPLDHRHDRHRHRHVHHGEPHVDEGAALQRAAGCRARVLVPRRRRQRLRLRRDREAAA